MVASPQVKGPEEYGSGIKKQEAGSLCSGSLISVLQHVKTDIIICRQKTTIYFFECVLPESENFESMMVDDLAAFFVQVAFFSKS